MRKKIISLFLALFICIAPFGAVQAAEQTKSEPAGSVLASPTNFSISLLGSGNVYFEWDAVAGAVSYELAYEKNGIDTVFATTSNTGHESSMSALSGATSFKVRAKDNSSVGSYSAVVNFVPSPSAAVPDLSAGITSAGVFVHWSPFQGASGYLLERKNGADYSTVYRGSGTNYLDTSFAASGIYTYRISAYDSTGAASSVYSYCHMNVIPVTAITSSPATVKLNIGAQYQIPYKVSPAKYNLGNITWTSSAPGVASVDNTGLVTASSPGQAVINASAVGGASLSFVVNVYGGDNQATIRVSKVDGPFDQSLGRRNRLTGTVVSDYNIRKVIVRVYNAAGIVEKSVTKKVTGSRKTYGFGVFNSGFPFNKLTAGSKILRIYAYNTVGGGVVYSKAFNVSASVPPSGQDKVESAIAWAYSRMGDPYSQMFRGALYYTDCSYLVQWCYYQVGVILPGNSRTQTAYFKEHNKTIARSQLQRGDLVFYTSDGSTATNKVVHVAIYLGDDMIIESVGRGVSVGHMGHPTIFARPC